jgi:L-ascorbate metabolism protein UlaG (beta-lactamase superfamily)
MKRQLTRRHFLALSASGAAAAALVACGDDDGDGGDASPAVAATMEPTTAPSPAITAGADNGAAGLRWYGQSMFLITSPSGTRLLLDPFGDIGYTLPPPLDVDVATITHEHPDHNNDALAASGATVLRGLTTDNWATIDETIGDVRIYNIRTYHDDQRGAARGRNSIFVFETAGLRIAHLGDLGHQLDDAQVSALGDIDVLMVPIGGGFTVDPAGATELTDQLAPSLVFPMHYKTDRVTFNLATVDQFTGGKQVSMVGSTETRLGRDTLPDVTTVYVLDYE